jgi:hypothetical protein
MVAALYAKLACRKAAATIPALRPLHLPFALPSWAPSLAMAKVGLRWLSLHTGLPALVVAAILIVVGYRLLKKTARFAVEVALVAAFLVAATSAGWLRW